MKRILVTVLCSLFFFIANSQIQFVSGRSWKYGDSVYVGTVKYYAKKDIASAIAIPKEGSYWTTTRIITLAKPPDVIYATKAEFDKYRDSMNKVVDSMKISPPTIPPVPTPIPPTAELPTVRIDDFKLSTETDYYHAWIRAKNALPNGGTIRFGEGTYSIDTATLKSGWYLEKSNLTLIGEGIDKTILTAASNIETTLSNETRLRVPFVRGFILSDTAYTFTYKNTLKKNDAFIVLKDMRFADSIKVGDKMMFIGGSHYFDQEFGELITIIGKSNDTLFTENPFSGSYSIDSVPYANILTSDFIMPPKGKSVTAYVDINRGGVKDRTISVGDNIFIIAGISGTAYTLMNIGKGNDVEGTLVKAGAHLMCGRIIALWNHTQNLKIGNLTILGQQDRVLRLDNTYNATLDNVKIQRNSTATDGFIYTLDYCRNMTFNNCEFVADSFAQSQISRSSGDIAFKKTTFKNVRNDASEYSFNVKFDSCIFYQKKKMPFVLGNTCRKSFITNNTFNLDSVDRVFESGEIQNLNNVQREYALVGGNIFNIMGTCGNIIDFGPYGKNYFIGNNITGGTLTQLTNCLNRIEDGTGLYPVEHHIDSNYIDVIMTRYLFVGGIYSGTITGNQIKNTGATKGTGFLNYITGKPSLVSDNTFEYYFSPLKGSSSSTIVNNIIK